MLSHYGDGIIAPTAAANSGILAFSVISLGMGVLWVVNTLVSQAFGRKDYRECGQFMWQGVWFSLAFWVVMLPLLPLAGPMFSGMGHERALARAEATYLQIIVALSALKLVGTAVQQFLLAVDRAHAVAVSTVIGVGANALVAWVMIFGKLGIAPMGVRGAAWAQNIGVGIETLVAIAFALAPTLRHKFDVLDWRLRTRQMQTLLRVGIPSGVQVVAEVLAWGAWGNFVMAAFGTKGMAATTFVFRYMAVSFMPAFGIGTAVTALVGRYIGRRRPDIAVQRAHLGFKVSLGYMLGCALLFVLFRRPLIAIFAHDQDVIQLGAMMLVFAAAYQVFDATYIVYYGALRGAGDTFVPALATAIFCWSITVCGGYFLARSVPQLGPAGPWYAASAYGAILSAFIVTRFLRGKWRTIDLEHPDATAKVRGFDVLPAKPVVES
jgi:MATE family multidrug resistance protein